MPSPRGGALGKSVRLDFERRFGHDFGRVRVHTGAEATESARDLSARAYTIGSDIVFGQGQYEPGTQEGRKLLAHELTHVVQQNAVGRPRVQRQPESESAGSRGLYRK